MQGNLLKIIFWAFLLGLVIDIGVGKIDTSFLAQVSWDIYSQSVFFCYSYSRWFD